MHESSFKTMVDIRLGTVNFNHKQGSSFCTQKHADSILLKTGSREHNITMKLLLSFIGTDQ